MVENHGIKALRNKELNRWKFMYTHFVATVNKYLGVLLLTIIL